MNITPSTFIRFTTQINSLKVLPFIIHSHLTEMMQYELNRLGLLFLSSGLKVFNILTIKPINHTTINTRRAIPSKHNISS